MTGAMGVKAAVAAELSGLKMQVTPTNVLQVHHAIRAEAELLSNKVRKARAQAVVRPAGTDPVSYQAVDGFNPKITNLLDQCQAYVDALLAGADELAGVARLYGHTEQQINASFDRFQKEHPPPATAPPWPGPSIPNFDRLTANPAGPPPSFPAADRAGS